MRSWYVAKTKPRQEAQTANVLAHRGVEVYLPKIAVWKGGLPRTKATKVEPLFPGYLFARLDMYGTDWLQARCSPGIVYFLGGDGRATAIPDELVEAIRVRSEVQQRFGWRAQFKAGERVVITNGPLAGLEAVFDGHLSASGRSRVFVEVLSRLVSVVVSAANLKRAS